MCKIAGSCCPEPQFSRFKHMLVHPATHTLRSPSCFCKVALAIDTPAAGKWSVASRPEVVQIIMKVRLDEMCFSTFSGLQASGSESRQWQTPQATTSAGHKGQQCFGPCAVAECSHSDRQAPGLDLLRRVRQAAGGAEDKEGTQPHCPNHYNKMHKTSNTIVVC